jgi:hypothetical protein
MINSSDMNLFISILIGQYYVIRYYLYDNIKVIYHNSIAYNCTIFLRSQKKKPTLTKAKENIQISF